MTTDNTKQNPTVEAKTDDAELNEEMLEQMSGGAGPRCGFPRRRIKMPTVPDESKEGGATGTW